jgi:hypothetical protein
MAAHSTEQADGGLSLDTQRQQIIGYAMMKGWQISEFFVEAGVSGSVKVCAFASWPMVGRFGIRWAPWPGVTAGAR